MSAPYRFGPFYLDARLAVGGTAEVYLARPAQPGADLPDKLVVKRLLPHFATDKNGRTMFEREARLHAAVTHPNVVTVFGAGVDDKGEPYLAMEYIDGVDGYRLLRRLRREDELLPVGVAVYIARQVLSALESVHAARDPSGGSLGIVHRDVSPSNIYLSREGTIKLGDFGIARSTTRATLRSEAGHVLKGKFAYLSPEQVAGEPSDHRADLFSLATVLAEMLLNRPLFPGSGQLAILLAIRDCKIGALQDIRHRLPPGLFEVLSRALSRDPAARYPTARAFADALSPFEADARLAVREIAARVRWVSAAPSSDNMQVVRESVRAFRAMKLAQGEAPPESQTPRSPTTAPPSSEASPPSGSKTEEYELLPSYVECEDGKRLGPWTFARLMEALATGQVQRTDKIDFCGRGFQQADQIEEFARFFPITATTNQLRSPGTPDFRDQVGWWSMLRALLSVLLQRQSGVLFAERSSDTGEAGRKELYFVGGRLHHVASSNASELLGEYLVRRGTIAREELDLALAILPRYGGRMGDTLISMGLVGPVDIFRAIREQGRDRVIDLFKWTSGSLTFYREPLVPHVEFPLDLDLASLVVAGVEAANSDADVVARYRTKLDRPVSPLPSDDASTFDAVTWPASVQRVRAALHHRCTVRDVVRLVSRAGVRESETLRAIDILLGAELVRME